MKRKSFSFLLPAVLLMNIYGFSQTQSSASNPVYCFIDADCDNCSIKDSDHTKIWVTTETFFKADRNDRELLLKKFQTQISTQVGADSALLKRTVFRFMDNLDEIKKTYASREEKMKRNGYKIIKIQFAE